MEQEGTCRPVPAPRRLYPDLPKSDYENVTIDINKKLNINAENLHMNKNITDKVPVSKVFLVATPEGADRGDSNSEWNYNRVILTETNDLYGPNVNAEVPDIITSAAVAAPATPTTPTKKTWTDKTITTAPIYAKPTPSPRPRPIVAEEIYDDIPAKSATEAVANPTYTGTISKDAAMLRKAPEIPPKMNANAMNRSQQRHSITSELSTTSSHSNHEPTTFANSTFFHSDNLKKSSSNVTINSTESSSENNKFKSPSPGDILKSLGATSKLLSESIGERVANKAKDVKHKFDKNFQTSSEVISNLGMETTNRIKRLGNNFTLTKKDKTKDKENMPSPAFDVDRPQTLPPNDQVFNTISFSSPLQHKAHGLDDLRTNELDESYDMPCSLKTPTSTPNKTVAPPPYEHIVLAKPPQHTLDRNYASNRSVMVQRHIAAEAASMALAKQNSSPNLTNTSINRLSGVSPPMPSFPPPALPTEFEETDGAYGKLNPIKPARLKRRKNYEQIELRRTRDSATSSNTIRPNIDSAELHQLNLEAEAAERKESLLLRERTNAEEQRIPMPDRCSSWEYTEDSRADSGSSSPEPVYVNQEITYGRVFEMATSNNDLLPPQSSLPRQKACQTPEGAVGGAVQPPKDIIYEFDPLLKKTSTICRTNKSNQLLLLEHMLEEDIYGTTTTGTVSKSDDDVSMCTSEEDNNNIAATATPTTPAKPTAESQLSPGARQLRIIHQNARLLSDSMENMIDDDPESKVKPYLSRVDDAPSRKEPVDLSRPSQNRTNWFVSDNREQTSTQTRVNPFNKLNIDDGESPPSYSEAIGIDDKPNLTQNEQKTMASRFKNTMNVFTNVRIRDALKRKSSIKTSRSSSDVRVTLKMVPRPVLSPLLVRYEGQLVRFPSGVVEDILKEMQNRRAILRERQFQTYLDHEMKTPKEMIPLECITTVQCVSNNRVTDSATQFYCFEITTIVPKSNSSGNSTANIQAMSNPNFVMTSGTTGNCKHQRVTHLYGVIKESERDIWMQKLLESLTDTIPSKYNCHYYRAGWCYLKNSISSEWSGTWLVLKKTHRRLAFVSEANMNVEKMDLRKARCIVLKDTDESIDNLHVEKGPILMIDCPPFSVYMIMSSPRETKTWRHIIREVAHNNGFMLNEQQLTKYNVPVIVDKCINFVYIHGSMSEGIYRKSGSENSISKLMLAFRADAFNVEITRNEYNEHDVANVLKRFMRDLPERLLGKLSESFICVSELSKASEKIPIYKELLARLAVIERETLKKIVSHLAFISSQKIKNKMSIQNLCLIWGPTLLNGQKTDQMEYSQKEADVLADLVILHKNLFPLSPDEIKREEHMLSCLQKYYAASETLTDSVKQSGDLKLWITVDPNPENESEEKKQINVTILPSKTAYELCKELSKTMGMGAHEFCVFEVILNGTLERPLHHDTKILDVVLNWSYWPEDDRKDNYLVVKPLGMLKEIQRVVKNTAIVTPSVNLKFADNRTKSFKCYLCELRDGKIVITKKDKNDKITIVREIFLHNTTAYLGIEKKRNEGGNGSWAITFVERTQTQILRSRDAPFIGHVLTSSQWVDRIIWYSSIWYCLYGDNILPPAEIIFK